MEAILNIAYKYTPGSRELVMTRIDTMEPQPKARRSSKAGLKGTSKKRPGRTYNRSALPAEPDARNDPF
jgi:hypothetical protein